MSQQFNLYNPAFEHKRDLLSFNGVVSAWSAGFVVFVVVILALMLRVNYLETELAHSVVERDATQAQMKQLAGQLAARKPDAKLAARVRQLEQGLSGRQEVLSTLHAGVIGDTRGFSAHLKAFARQSFAGLWLTGLKVAGAGEDVVLEGRAIRPELVPGYLQRLNREEVMRGHAFAELQMRRPDTDGGKSQVTAKYVEFRLSTLPQADPEGGGAR